MRVLLAVAVATATGAHEARAQRLPPAPQSPGAPTDSNPWWLVGGVVVGGLIAVLVGKQVFGDPAPTNRSITPPLPPGGGGGVPSTTQLSIDQPSPPRQSGTGGGTTVQALRRGFDLPPPGAPHLDNECVLDIPAGVSTATLDAIAARHQMARLETVDIRLTGRRLHRWRLDGGGSVADMIRAVSRTEPAVAGMQAQFLFTLAQSPPAQLNADQYAPQKLNLAEAHRLATGNRVLIAVIDSEVDASHPDLFGAITAKFDATDKERPHAHGTGMAGAMAGRRTVLGTAPQVGLLAVNAFSTSTREPEGTTFSILKGLDWAATQGARVINMSFAGPADPRLQDALAKANRKGIVLIAAAGNAGPNSPPLFPAADPNVIAVTATDIDDGLFPGANRGRHIAVAAPGVDVLVPAPNGAYQFTTGTSVAAAEVSGVAALLIERNASLKPTDVRRILASTARDLGPKGHDASFGAGLVNALRAVTAAGAGRAQPGF
jgi:Subtilase family